MPSVMRRHLSNDRRGFDEFPVDQQSVAQPLFNMSTTTKSANDDNIESPHHNNNDDEYYYYYYYDDYDANAPHHPAEQMNGGTSMPPSTVKSAGEDKGRT